MSTSAIQLHRWSRREYDRMIASGVFHPEARLELVDGEIFHMTPQGSLHATAIQLVADALKAVFHENYAIRIQLPLALDDHSEPEPDISVVTGTARDYKERPPKDRYPYRRDSGFFSELRFGKQAKTIRPRRYTGILDRKSH